MRNRDNPFEYELLYEKHFRLMSLYAQRIVGSQHSAEDVVQDVFISLLDVDLDELDNKERYLYRCVRNASINYRRKNSKATFTDIDSKEAAFHQWGSDDSSFTYEMEYMREIGKLYERIEKLPPRARQIFKMICLEQKSYSETADTLSLSLHTVKTQMSRSFKALRKKIPLFLLMFFSLLY